VTVTIGGGRIAFALAAAAPIRAEA